MVWMMREELLQVLVGATIELKDILPGISNQKQPQIGNHIQQPVQDLVVGSGKILCFVDGQEGNLTLHPLPKLRIIIEHLHVKSKDVFD